MALSLLLHSLLFLFLMYRPGPERTPPPPHYRIRLVDLPTEPKPAPPLPGQRQARVSPPSTPARPSEKAPDIKGIESVPAPGVTAPRPPQEVTSPGRVLGPRALYDTEVIDATARESLEKEAREGDGVTFSTKDMMYRGYLDMLRQKVESIWSYPPEAAERGLYGDLIIRFVILKDGSLGEIKVLRTSGYSMLDEAALEALRDGVPYWPLPKGWERASLPITGRFIYTNYGSTIR